MSMETLGGTASPTRHAPGSPQHCARQGRAGCHFPEALSAAPSCCQDTDISGPVALI